MGDHIVSSNRHAVHPHRTCLSVCIRTCKNQTFMCLSVVFLLLMLYQTFLLLCRWWKLCIAMIKIVSLKFIEAMWLHIFKTPSLTKHASRMSLLVHSSHSIPHNSLLIKRHKYPSSEEYSLYPHVSTGTKENGSPYLCVLSAWQLLPKPS